LYSPTIDPEHQEGDERFGTDPLIATFELRDTWGNLITMGDFPEGESSWLLFFDASLAPGNYQLSSSVSGKGKNVFVPLLEIAGERRSFKSYDPTINVGDTLWREGVRFSTEESGCSLNIYDGDGPTELMMRLVYPNGERRNLTIPDNRSWLSYEVLDQPGDYAVELRQTDTALQATNALRFRVSCNDVKVPLELEPDLTNQAHPIEVVVIDSSGNPLEFPYTIEGEESRLVSLKEHLGYELLETQIEGGEATGTGQARFGPEGGKVTFVLERFIAIPEPDIQVSIGKELRIPQLEPKISLSPLVTIAVPDIQSSLAFPDFSLTAQFSSDQAFLCQTPTWHIEVSNTGKLGSAFSLQASLPQGVLVLSGSTTWQAYLAPGETTSYDLQFELTPQFDPTQAFRAQLSGFFEPRQAEAFVELLRPEVSLERISPKGELYAGDEAVIRYSVTNPGKQPVAFRLEPAFANLEPLDLPERLTVPAQGSASTEFKVKVSEGIGAMQVIPFACDPLALELHAAQDPSIYREEVNPPPSLPVALQSTTVSIDMAAYKLPVVKGLVLVQMLPEGVSYLSGSTFINGEAAADPVKAANALIFELPDVSLATLSFRVRSEQPYLATTEDSSLIVLGKEPELLLGKPEALELYQTAVPLQSFSLRTRQRSGAVILNPANFSLIRSGNTTALSADTPLGDTVKLFINNKPVADTLIGTKTYDESLGRQTFDYVGLELDQGPNRIRLESRNTEGRLLRDVITVYIAGTPHMVGLKPLSPLVADSNTPLLFEVRVQDAWGNVPPDSLITFEIDGAEASGEDATEQQSGFQVQIEDGLGQLSLKPLSSPGVVTLTSMLSKELGSASFEIKSNLRDWIVVGNASAGLGLNDSSYFGLEGSVFARGRIFDSFLLTLAAQYPLEPLGLFGETNFTGQNNDFPLTGSSDIYAQDAYSQQGIYARLERDQSYLQYGDFVTALEGPYLNISRPYTGLSSSWYLGDFRLVSYLSQAALGDLITDLYIKTDGTRIYPLPHSQILQDSLQLSTVKGDCESPQNFINDDNDPLIRELKANLDYSLDKTGIIRLNFPLPISDTEGHCYYLVANYALEPGSAAEYDWQFGAQAFYQLEGLGLRLGHYQENMLGSNYNRVSSAGLLFSYGKLQGSLDLALGQNQDSSGLALSTQVSYSADKLGLELRYSLTSSGYRSATLTSDASSGQQLDAGLSYSLSPEIGLSGTLSLGQAYQTGDSSFGLSGQARFSGGFDLGFAEHSSSLFGLTYQKSNADSGVNLLLGSNLSQLFGFDNTEFSISHQQLLFGTTPSSTDFSVGFELLDNLSLRFTDRLIWGQGNRFIVGFDSGFSNRDALHMLCPLTLCPRLESARDIGETQLSGEYELSNSPETDAGRLLFNLNTAYPINDKLSLKFAASQITDLQDSTGSELGLSLGADYQTKELLASVNYDLHFGSSFKQGFNASSTFDLNNELSAQLGLDYLLDSSSNPEQGLKFSIAAAYRANLLSVLTRQDLRFGRYAANLATDLLGDTRLNFQVADDWSLRAGYIYALEPDLGFRDQFSLGATKLIWPGTSLAGYARLFHNWQDGSFSTGASLELSQNLGCGVNLIGGYNFFDGLGPNYGAHFGQNGAFLRLDLVFDEDWRCGAAELSGKIQTIDSKALAGVRLELLDSNDTLLESTLSDEFGRYSFKRLVPGDYQLRLNVPYGFDSDLAEAGVIKARLELAWAETKIMDFAFSELP
ncbi:MAG: hypothetical protein KC422_23025, partial [Trueperaceae bacterium]|nr:hypothetical protein [Trueperaceae bacterium]